MTAALGTILVLGVSVVRGQVEADYAAVAGILNKDVSAYSSMDKYSEELEFPVLVYDRNKNFLSATEQDRGVFVYRQIVGFVRSEGKIYLGFNREELISGVPLEIIIYSDLSGIIKTGINISKAMLLFFTAVFFLALIAVAFSGRGIFQPIKEMTQTVKEISEKNLNLRLNVSGSKNELKELTLTFNEMMNRIEEQYNKQKQFVSDASHELRTPIAVIQGYAVMLDRWGKNDQEVLQESIASIKNEAHNMRELVDKLLFLARHENSSFIFQKEEFSLTEMILETARETQIIDSAHIITYDINQEVSVYADKNMLKQAIRIFIDNAIKYSPAGGEIAIGLGKEDKNITVSIKDNGIGMTRNELKHIFDRFYRSDQSRTKDKGGHGLGLAIAKIIVLNHNGKIRVKSKLDEGSEFTIILPGSSISYDINPENNFD